MPQLSGRECRMPDTVFVPNRNNTNLKTLLMPTVTKWVFVSKYENDDVRLFLNCEVKKSAY